MHFPIARRIYLPACLFAVIVFGAARAQTVQTRYELFTVNEGLPQNYLLGLAQDSTGFIWVGTKDGLARYDGYRFKVYRHGKDSLHTPAANNVTNLYTDHRGFLWIQYDNRAVDRYDPSTGIFHHISENPAWNQLRAHLSAFELIVDHHDNLWLPTIDRGFFRYTIASGQWTVFNRASGLISDSARAIFEDHSGKIWMVTSGGLTVLNYNNGKLTNIPQRLTARTTFTGRALKAGAGELDDGKIIITSLDSVYWIYDPVKNNFQRKLFNWRVFKASDAGVGNTNLVRSPGGDRWFICNGRMLKIEPKSGEVIEINDPSNPFVPDASALLVDRSGTLWFGKNAQGLCKINLHAARFVSKKYRHQNFETDILVNELGVAFADLPPGFDNPAFGYLYRNTYDTANRVIWIQNYLLGRNEPKIIRYDAVSGKLITKQIAFSKYGEVGISADQSGNIWLAGINSWIPYKLKQQGIHWEKEQVDTGIPPDSLYNAGKVAINPVIDKEIMWVMESNMNIDFGNWRLAAIHLRSKEVKWYPVKPDNAEAGSSLLMMVNDPATQKYLWIGTTGNGLLRFDKTTGDCHAFTTDDGLPNNTIYAIVADHNNQLWLSSNKGITRFDPVSHAVRNFDISDGLISNEFNRWHCFRLPDGRIAFGGITGYTIFNPADIKDDEFQPRVLLSNLLINNKPLADSSAINTGNLNAIDRLALPYDQNFLNFEFASDEYNVPQKINYRYRLTDFDDDWVYARSERFASYTKLPPGDYTLEINASNVSGIWSNKIKTIRISIAPPWWRTWWAIALYAVLALGLVLAFFYYRLRRIRLKQELILHQQKTEQLKAIDEMKSRFFSNITHEFRTPLSLIISPVEKLQAELKDEHARQTLGGVQRNAERLLQLINQLLDLSKLETGNMQLNFSRGRLDDFIREMVSTFKPLADQKQLDLLVETHLPHEYLFEADKLKTILFNLLSNAIKFTRTGGKIKVIGTEEANQVISLSVTDTGIGIAPAKLPFIFDRFYQADDSHTRSYEGTGIGLALVKELIGFMHGSVSAESSLGNGTCIRLSFPAAQARDSEAPLWTKETAVAQRPVDSGKTMAAGEPTPQNGDAHHPLILLVEDNPELLSFLRESFEGRFRIITAGDGSAAFDMAREELPDLVISDVMMPGMDGYDLCRKLKSDTATNHIAIILLSAKASYESRLGGLQLGADDYISKPFHFAELETRVQNLLDHQEKLRVKYREQLNQKGPVIEIITENEHPFLTQIYSIIDDMIDDPQLGASKLAEKNAMSLRTLNRKLNALLGLTAGDLIRQYRLQKSLGLLKAGHPVSEAAYMVGFETPSYFSQCFKEHYGVPPKDYFAGTP